MATPSARLRVDVRPKPRDWVDPRDLLNELLVAFDLERARKTIPLPPRESDPTFDKEWERISKLATSGLANDATAVERFGREVEAVADVLGVLVVEVRKMLQLAPGPQRTALQRAIVTAWNHALASNDLVTLPTLCEMCGTPVVRRRLEKAGAQVALSTTCDATCKNARTQRRKRERAKKA